MKLIILLFLNLIIYGCSPKVDNITLYKYYTLREDHENKDATISIHLEVNTYEDFFGGRESIFSFKREFYSFNLLKIDTTYDSKFIKISGYPRHKEEFFKVPLKKGFIKLNQIENDCLLLTFEFKDSLLPPCINGKYKLYFQKIDKGSSEYSVWNGEIFKTK